MELLKNTIKIVLHTTVSLLTHHHFLLPVTDTHHISPYNFCYVHDYYDTRSSTCKATLVREMTSDLNFKSKSTLKATSWNTDLIDSLE